MNTNKNFPQLIITMFSIAVAYFLSKLSDSTDLNGWIIFVVILALSIVVWVINIYFYEIESSQLERKVEGYWIQNHNSDKKDVETYCIMEIKCSENKRLSISGTVYDYCGEIIATFESKYVGVNQEQNRIVYIYDGKYIKGVLPGNGYGQVSFDNRKSGLFSSGNGYFQDEKSENQPINYEIDRIDADMCKQFIKKISIEKSSDKRLLVRSFHKNKQEITNR